MFVFYSTILFLYPVQLKEVSFLKNPKQLQEVVVNKVPGVVISLSKPL